MNESQSTRDPGVGAALGQIEVPAHAPDFDERLRRRLARERGRQSRPRSRRRVSLRLTLVAAVAGVAALAVGIRVAGDSVEVAGAAEIKARVQAALESVQTMQGRVTSTAVNPLDPTSGERTVRRWEFAMTADGDMWLRDLDRPARIVYDSRTGTERQLTTSESAGGGVFAVELTGLAPGPPDPSASDWILERDLAAVVRALLAARDPAVREIEFDGRQAWRVDIDVRPNAIWADADRLAVTVDQATGIPVRVVATLRSAFRQELRVDGLDLVTPVRADRLTFPADAEVFRRDSGFRRVPLERVRETVGYAPLVPDWVPPGFVLSEVAVARRAQPTGRGERRNPPSKGVVSLSYRRGFDQLLVTTRLARPSGADAAWKDPLATGEGFVDEPESVTVDGGALAGAEAELLIVPRATPHLWALTDRLVVTVSGDLDRSELLGVAGSLRERG
jgi:hypothetical protein